MRTSFSSNRHVQIFVKPAASGKHIKYGKEESDKIAREQVAF